MVHHKNFKTIEGTLDWEAPLYKLYEKAKKVGTWNPAEIDFTKDVNDYQSLRHEDKLTAFPLIAAFSAGEEAVTIDILPMMHSLARQGRLEDTMYLTTFVFDEAKHVELFSRWQQEIGIGDMNLSMFHDDNYKRIFYEALPESMNRLFTDDSPEAVIRASTVYNMIVEGTLAKTGFHAFREIYRKADLFPGILQGIDYINQDEARHIQFGIYTISRLVAGNETNYKIFRDYMEELSQYAFGYVDYLTSLQEQSKQTVNYESTLNIDTDLMRNYVRKQVDIRISKIDRVRRFDSIEELEKAVE